LRENETSVGKAPRLGIHTRDMYTLPSAWMECFQLCEHDSERNQGSLPYFVLVVSTFLFSSLVSVAPPVALTLFRSCLFNFLFSSVVSVAPQEALPSFTDIFRRDSPSTQSFSLRAVPCRSKVTIFPLTSAEGCRRLSPALFTGLPFTTPSAPALHPVVHHGILH